MALFRKRIFTDYRYAWLMLTVGLLLRLVIILLYYVGTDYIVQDAHFYILVSQDPRRLTFSPHASTLAITPLYPMFLIPFFNLIPSSMPLTQFVAARVTQAVLDTITVGVVYLITQHLFGERAAKVAIMVQALDMRYIFVVGALATETLFITLFCVFMLAYLKAAEINSLKRYAGAGILLGLAALTRPVPLLFPAVIAIHAWFHPVDRRQALKGAGVLALITFLMIAPLSIRGWIIGGAPIPGSTTAFVHLWQGTRDDADAIGGAELEEEAVEDVNNASESNAGSFSEINPLEFITAAADNIFAKPTAWISLTGGRLVRSYLQPYGTVLLTVETERTFAGTVRAVLAGNEPLISVTTYPGLWRRSLMYVAHFWGLLLGVIGIVLAWRNYRWETFPLLGWIAYSSVILSVLLVEPRYLFPLMFAFNLYAAYAAARLWDALQARGTRPTQAVGAQP